MAILPGVVAALVAGAQDAPPPPTPAQIEAEVLGNVRSQPLGDGTLEDLGLPEPFLRRVADRIVRSSYEERYRVVVKDLEAKEASAALPPNRGTLIAIAVGALALVAIGWSLISRRLIARRPIARRRKRGSP